ncbi:hypothetical protein Y032_0332g2776 [Ancylostoma ceylanicum]|uniref:Uncharacterized protein n=1 Tax=Ancylostoma ceylanicum TaxID=53326 RepID=A0A016RZ61_9BILA|nr:hypothetical protein Y032_0332g2776 [Ancylostoma ceylanicum]
MEVQAFAFSSDLNHQKLKILQVLPKVQNSKDSCHIGVQKLLSTYAKEKLNHIVNELVRFQCLQRFDRKE